jgi:hypothetical protein
MGDLDFTGNSLVNNSSPDSILSGNSDIAAGDSDQNMSGNEVLTNSTINYIYTSSTNVYGGTSISGTNIYGGTNVYGGTSISSGGTAGGTSYHQGFTDVGSIQYMGTGGTFTGKPHFVWDDAARRIILQQEGNNNYIGADYYEVNTPYSSYSKTQMVGSGLNIYNSNNNGATINILGLSWTSSGNDVYIGFPSTAGTNYQPLARISDTETYWSDSHKHQIGINITSPNALTAGTKGFGPINFRFKIQKATILLDTAGTARVDILKGPLSGYPIGTSITSGTGVSISSPNISISDGTLDSWTLDILNSEFVIYKLVDVDTTIRTINLTLHGVKL